MPKSTVPKDKSLKKSVPRRRTDALRGSETSGGGTQNTDTDQLCLRVFTTKTQVFSVIGLVTGGSIRLLPDPIDSSEIQMIHGSRNLGRYTGSNKPTLLRCMRLGYTYAAEVLSIQDLIISIEVRGEGT